MVEKRLIKPLPRKFLCPNYFSVLPFIMQKTFIGLILLVFGLLFGALFVGNFGFPDWLGGSGPSTVVLGRKDFQPIAPANLSEMNRVFREVSQRVKPSVVYIMVEGKSVEMPNDEMHRFEDAIPGLRRRESSAGSGVIISQEGYIVTNHHVVEGGERITVLLDDKREFEARLIGSDPSTDIAVIRIAGAQNLPVAALGDDSQLAVGEWVLAIGSPFRLTQTVTAGIVSAVGRQIGIIDENKMPIEDFIQTDAAINPGNSGGALVNLRGELVGINTAIATEDGSYEGYGFAVPIGLAARVTEDLIRYQRIQRGFLGITIAPVTSDLARQLRLPRIEGVLITRIAPNSAAASSGLQRGDVVLKINGKEVNEVNQLQRTIAMNRPGEQVSVHVFRNGAESNIPVTLLGREESNFGAISNLFSPQPAPKPNLPPADLAKWGFSARPLTPAELQQFGVQHGVWITAVVSGSPAGKAGLPTNTVLTHLEDARVQSTEQLKRLLSILAQNDPKVLFRVTKQDRQIGFYEVTAP